PEQIYHRIISDSLLEKPYCTSGFFIAGGGQNPESRNPDSYHFPYIIWAEAKRQLKGAAQLAVANHMLLPIAAVPSSKNFYYIVAMLMNNTANTLSANETELVWPWEDDIDDAIVLIVLYYIMGILAILANGLLLYSLCKQRKHRHNLPLVGFIIGSATYGISYIYTAMYRTYVIVSKPDGTIILRSFAVF
ncbi:hypothetical protein M514_04107, partial [Trichuris suis]